MQTSEFSKNSEVFLSAYSAPPPAPPHLGEAPRWGGEPFSAWGMGGTATPARRRAGMPNGGCPVASLRDLREAALGVFGRPCDRPHRGASRSSRCSLEARSANRAHINNSMRNNGVLCTYMGMRARLWGSRAIYGGIVSRNNGRGARVNGGGTIARREESMGSCMPGYPGVRCQGSGIRCQVRAAVDSRTCVL